MVGVENHVIPGSGCGFLHHAGAGDYGGFGPFLIYLDDGVLIDEAQAEGVVGHGLEIGEDTVEGPRHAHIAENVVQLDVELGLESGKPEIHLAGNQVVAEAAPVGLFEGGGDVGKLALARGQEDIHGKGTVPVGQSDYLIYIVVVIAVGLVVLLHHLNLPLLVPGFILEDFFGGDVLFELFLPLALEVHGVEQIGQHVGAHFVQHLGDEVVGVACAPAVHGLERARRVGEIQVGHLGLVVLAHRGLVAVLQRPAVIHEDGVGDGESGFPVQGRKLLQHG